MQVGQKIIRIKSGNRTEETGIILEIENNRAKIDWTASSLSTWVKISNLVIFISLEQRAKIMRF